MARTLEVQAHDDERTVTIWIRSDAERDVSVHVDGLDVIQQIVDEAFKKPAASHASAFLVAEGAPWYDHRRAA